MASLPVRQANGFSTHEQCKKSTSAAESESAAEVLLCGKVCLFRRVSAPESGDARDAAPSFSQEGKQKTRNAAGTPSLRRAAQSEPLF